MTENKNNIGLLLRDFNVIGGIERVATTLSNELSKHYNVFVIVYSNKNRLFDFSGKLLILDQNAQSNKIIHRFTRSFKKFFMLRNFVKKYNLGSIISFGEHPNILNILSRSTNNSILTIHSYKSKEESERRDFRGVVNKVLIRFLYNKSDKIITVSRSLKKDLVSNFNLQERKIVPIYNPFNTDDIIKRSSEPLSTEFQKKSNAKRLITIGRICHTKAFWHLIRSFSEVKKEFADIELVIIGEAFLDVEIKIKDQLLTLINELNLEDCIRFIDYTENPYNLLKSADIFVSSSILEGFGNVIVESMICCLPVIFPDCKAGPREILAPGSRDVNLKDKIEFAEFGILTPVCDGKFRNAYEPLTNEEKFLLDAIKVLLNDKNMSKDYSDKGKARAFDFDSKRIINEYLEIINEN
ncbi:MAG: glycosyltransferase [Candidatus Delongbacteria bacterium]|nr:glycosyltransferase [Candidatus Delongbacteria bacterium]